MDFNIYLLLYPYYFDDHWAIFPLDDPKKNTLEHMTK